VRTGDPVPGAAHDAKARRTSGLAGTLAGRLHGDDRPGVIADLAYIGTGVLTGFKRVNGRKLSATQREFNRSIDSWRAPVERAVAHLRDWKMPATGYHGLLYNLAVITRLEIYRTWT
jgi:hypothetical protein